MALNDLAYANHDTTSLNLNDGTTYRLMEVRGIYDDATEPVTVKLPRNKPVGIFVLNNQVHRAIEVDIRITATTLSSALTNLRALRKHFHVDSFRKGGLGTLTYTAFNNITRAIKCAPSERQDEKWLRAQNGGGSTCIATVRLIAPEPSFYNATATTETGAFSGTSDVTVECTNNGDEDAYVTITYTTDGSNQLVNPQVTDYYSQALTIEQTMAVSKVMVLTLNPQTLSILYDGTNIFGKRASGQDIVVIAPGTHNLTFTADNAAANATIGLSWNDRYSTHG